MIRSSYDVVKLFVTNSDILVFEKDLVLVFI